ncbi:MAG TPA: molybdenum cofactor guanylyltransferase [Luteolibacter sp.]
MTAKPPLCGLVLAGGRSSRMGRDKATLVHSDGRTLVRRCCDLLRDAGCEIVAVSLRADQEIPAGLADVEIVRDPEGAGQGPLAGIIAGMHLRPDADWLVVACDLPRLDVKTLAHLVASQRAQDSSISGKSPSEPQPQKSISPPRRQGRENLKAGTSLIADSVSELGALGVLAVQKSSSSANLVPQRSLSEESSPQADEKFIAYRSEFDGLPEPLCALYSPAALKVLEQAQADDFRCPRKILIRNECRLLDPVTPRALDNANTPEDWETAKIP